MAKTLEEYNKIVEDSMKRVIPAAILMVLVGVGLPYLGSALMAPTAAGSAAYPGVAATSSATSQTLTDISYGIITLGAALIFACLMTWITLPVVYNDFLRKRNGQSDAGIA